MDKITNRIIYLENGSHLTYEGNYSEFWVNNKQKEENGVNKTTTDNGGKQKYQEQKKENRKKERSNRKRNPQIIESEIENTEKRIAELDELLQQEDVFSNFEKTQQIDVEYKELSAKLEKLYEEWEESGK